MRQFVKKGTWEKRPFSDNFWLSYTHGWAT